CPGISNQGRIYDDRPQLEITSKAVFAQIDWKFAEQWKTTLGIRYTQDHKFGRESLRLLCFDVPGCAGAPERFTNFLIDLTQLPTPWPTSATAAATRPAACGSASIRCWAPSRTPTRNTPTRSRSA